MSEQDVQAGVLQPFHVDRACPKDLAEQVETVWHQSAMVGNPCWTDDPARRVWGEHLCCRCLGCGYAWCEESADAYSAGEPPGGDVSIRKTATAEGVIGIEDAPGLVKTAAAQGWEPEDEAGLAEENDQADKLES